MVISLLLFNDIAMFIAIVLEKKIEILITKQI